MLTPPQSTLIDPPSLCADLLKNCNFTVYVPKVLGTVKAQTAYLSKTSHMKTWSSNWNNFSGELAWQCVCMRKLTWPYELSMKYTYCSLYLLHREWQCLTFCPCVCRWRNMFHLIVNIVHADLQTQNSSLHGFFSSLLFHFYSHRNIWSLCSCYLKLTIYRYSTVHVCRWGFRDALYQSWSLCGHNKRIVRVIGWE